MPSTSPRTQDARTLRLPLVPSRRVSAAVRQGDAFDLMQALAPESIDLLITSPPYWGHRSYEQSHNWNILQEYLASGGGVDSPPAYEWYRKRGGVLGLEPLPEWYVSHLVEILDRVKCCLKAAGSLWINIGDTYFARWSSIRESGRQGLGDQARQRRRTPMGGYRQEKQLLLIPARFAMAMQNHRWILRNDLIWNKPNIPPRPEVDRLRMAHEHFFHFVKRPTQGRAKYYYDLKHVEPGATDVVTCCVRPGQDGHSATFPEELIRPRILSSCPPGGTVLDPFCGTGRALAVAVDTGRSAIGFDTSPSFVRAAKDLIASRLGADDDAAK
jgi:site-specific DNA-methyltransferase (cytosine-N4-specific)